MLSLEAELQANLEHQARLRDQLHSLNTSHELKSKELASKLTAIKYPKYY